MKAHKISEKASRVGFDWEHSDQVFAKVMEELHEFEEAWEGGDPTRMEDELGDLLFAIANLGRFLNLNPEEALRKTISRFQKRFSYVEAELLRQGVPLEKATLEDMDKLWEMAKSAERDNKIK